MIQIKATFDKIHKLYCLSLNDIEKVLYPMADEEILRPALEKNLGKELTDKIWPEVSEWSAFNRQQAYETSKSVSQGEKKFCEKNGIAILLTILNGPVYSEPLRPPLTDLQYWGNYLKDYGVEIVRE